MLFILLMLLFIKMPPKRKSGHSVQLERRAIASDGEAMQLPMASCSCHRERRHASRDSTFLHVAVAAAEPIDAGAGAHHSGRSRSRCQVYVIPNSLCPAPCCAIAVMGRQRFA